jgi:hypothetical protein
MASGAGARPGLSARGGAHGSPHRPLVLCLPLALRRCCSRLRSCLRGGGAPSSAEKGRSTIRGKRASSSEEKAIHHRMQHPNRRDRGRGCSKVRMKLLQLMIELSNSHPMSRRCRDRKPFRVIGSCFSQESAAPRGVSDGSFGSIEQAEAPAPATHRLYLPLDRRVLKARSSLDAVGGGRAPDRSGPGVAGRNRAAIR